MIRKYRPTDEGAMNEDSNIPSMKRAADSKDAKAGDEASSSSSHPSKRTRIVEEDDTKSIEKFIPTPGKKFLLLHLQILRAVYDETNDANFSTRSTTSPEDEDGTVKEENWKIIQTFLKERDGIKSMFHQVQSCQGLHDEAVDFIQQQREEEIKSLNNGDWVAAAHAAAVPPLMRSSLLLYKTTQPSPHNMIVPRLYAGSGGCSLLSAAAAENHHGDDDDDDDESNNNNNQRVSSSSFGFIAALLRQKYEVANDVLTQKTNPYRKLLEDVRRRVDILGELRRKEQGSSSQATTNSEKKKNNNSTDNDNDNNDDSPDERIRLEDILSRQSQDSNAESLARLDTKLRLWNLLLNDLATTTCT